METAMAGPQKDASTYLGRADQARRIGRYAWALAAAGRRNEAQAKIDEALAMGNDLRPEDAAGVQYFVGEAWRALDDKVKAKQPRPGHHSASRWRHCSKCPQGHGEDGGQSAEHPKCKNILSGADSKDPQT